MDWISNRSIPEGKCIQLDLTSLHGQRLFFELIERKQVAFAWMAPSCGTASRVRGKAIDPAELPPGMKAPRPLRTSAFPGGLPGLTGVDKERVDKANILYDFYASVATECHRAEILWCVENPENSFMWETSAFQPVGKFEGVYVTSYHQCMHSNEPERRKKATSLYHNVEELCELGCRCDGKHEHAPWGIDRSDGLARFATSKERVYPILLTSRVVEKVSRALDRLGIKCQPKRHHKEARKELLGRQPRGSRGSQLIPNFKHEEWLLVDSANESFVSTWDKPLEADKKVGDRLLPTGSRRLAFGEKRGESGEMRVKVGFPWSQQEFMSLAKGLMHPFDTADEVGDEAMKTVARILARHPNAIQAERLERLAHYQRRAATLCKEERAVHASLHPACQPLLSKKRLLLFREMWQDAMGDDARLYQDLVSGFPIVGMEPPSGNFPGNMGPTRDLSGDADVHGQVDPGRVRRYYQKNRGFRA